MSSFRAASFLPSITWVPVVVVVLVVELKEHHHHTHTALFQSEGAGSKAGIPGGCCGCLFDRYMHGRASKGSTGLNGGLL
jgi:hypothetical protein